MHSIPIIPKNYFHSTCNNEAFNLYNTHNSQAFKHQDNSSRYFKASWWDSQSEKDKKKKRTTWTRYSPASHIRSPAFFKENPSLFCCGICGGGLWAMMGEVAESLLSSIVILDWFWFCCGVGGIFVGNCGSYLVENGLPLGFWSKLLFYIYFFLYFLILFYLNFFSLPIYFFYYYFPIWPRHLLILNVTLFMKTFYQYMLFIFSFLPILLNHS